MLGINRDMAVEQEWLRFEDPRIEIDKACEGVSGEMTSRPMTKEELRHYGGPLFALCESCGRELPQTRKYFLLADRGFQNICVDCVRKKRVRRKANE